MDYSAIMMLGTQKGPRCCVCSRPCGRLCNTRPATAWRCWMTVKFNSLPFQLCESHPKQSKQQSEYYVIFHVRPLFESQVMLSKASPNTKPLSCSFAVGARFDTSSVWVGCSLEHSECRVKHVDGGCWWSGVRWDRLKEAGKWSPRGSIRIGLLCWEWCDENNALACSTQPVEFTDVWQTIIMLDSWRTFVWFVWFSIEQ